MQYIVTSQQMNKIDKMGIEDFEIPSILLMESAAFKCYEFLNSNYNLYSEKILIFVASGNNGGDGLALARLLDLNGASVKIVSLYKNDLFTEDFRVNLEMVKNLDIDLYHNPAEDLLQLLIDGSSLIIDSILGTGISRELDSDLSLVVNLINKSHNEVISIDIPSGINSNDAGIMGTAIRADTTLTFEYLKLGHLLYPGREYSGDIRILKISLPKNLEKKLDVKTFTLSKSYASSILKTRKSNTHKGSYGKLAVIAGSLGLTGAAYLTAQAALVSGSGLTSLFIAKSLNPIMEDKLTEVMTLPVDDDGLSLFTPSSLDEVLHGLRNKDVCAIGPGLGTDERTSEFLLELIGKIDLLLLLDADALNILADRLDLLTTYNNTKILTPHPGEMSRLLKKDISSILSDPIGASIDLSKLTRSIVVLKGATSIVTNPEGDVYLNTTGNPGMASGGTGDVLSGVITSLLGQGYEPYLAAVLGVYIHGLAGDLAADIIGEISLTASDLLNFLPLAFKLLSR